MIAAYLRVSSRGQRDDSQRSEISGWLRRNGINLEKVHWYSDTQTGGTLDRTAFNRLQRDIFDGKVKTVVLWKLDRLSRRLRDGIDTLADWCERGVKVVVVTQQIELAGAVGRMMAALLLGLAEIETEYRRERQVAGIKLAKKRGVYRGRKPGTCKAIPARARELKAKGFSVKEVSTALGVTSRTVWRYLSHQRPASARVGK